MASQAMGIPEGMNSKLMPGVAGTNMIPVTAAAPTSSAPGVVNPLATTQNNPFAAPGSVAPVAGTATNGMAPGAVPVAGSTVQTNGINWNDGSNTVRGDFKDTYGAGTGNAISDVLKNLGTATDSAVQATNAQTELQAGKEYANIKASEAAGGVSPNSSTAALAAGDFYSGVNTSEQATTAQMELGEENTLLSTLTGEGKDHGPDESTFDSVLSGITDAGEIGGAAKSLFGL